MLDGLGSLGLRGRVLAWMAISGAVVFPAYLVSGFQFPLLINLLGRGRQDVARHTGVAYAWNTLGAIVGALGGAFLLIPGLTAPGVWQLTVVLLGLLGAAAVVLHTRQTRRYGYAVVVAALLLGSGLMLTAPGPTAVWRHSGIGAGRGSLGNKQGVNPIRDWAHTEQRELVWETEGREASIAIEERDGLTFAVNGKVDGNVTRDAMTQVMLGLVSAALHPAPQTSLVIGLGTGCSAGWLAEVGSMERVDVVEIEPGLREMARRCAPANFNVLEHPKANLVIGDGREILLTSRDRYDLIVSEPSNPYRAGISSLYTVQFYQAVRDRMKAGAFFSQWLQAYEVDTATVQTVYATLRAVFPVVELWVLQDSDLLFVCAMEPPRIEASTLRARLRTEPFGTALEQIWRAQGLEGFLGHFVAAPAFADAVRAGWPQLNSDNRMLVEYAFARTVGRKTSFEVSDLRDVVRALGLHRPTFLAGDEVNWEQVADAALLLETCSLDVIPPQADPSPDRGLYAKALNHFLEGDWEDGIAAWQACGRLPLHPLEQALVGEALAALGDEGALLHAGALASWDPVSAELLRARYHAGAGDVETARTAMELAIGNLQHYPWAFPSIVDRGLDLLETLSEQDTAWTWRILDLLSKPFVVSAFHDARTQALFDLALAHDPARAYQVMRATEPHPPWTFTALHFRVAAYRQYGDPLLTVAERDLRRFLKNFTPTAAEAWGQLVVESPPAAR
jgi:spermidine synthase